jgi:DNA polymerase-1
MLAIQEWIDSEKNNVKMIMQVHDELVFEMSADNAKNYAKKIRLMMEEAATLSVPLIVDIGIGNSWQEAH